MILRAIIFLIFFFFSTLNLSYSNENIVNQALNLSDKNKNKEAIDLLLTISEDPLAQYYLGAIYSEKLQDYESAITWYESCARVGDVDCQYYAYFINSEIFEDLEISQ
jgi:TPR repeat protein